MAARKKKKKRAAARRGKAVQLNVVVGSKVKEAIKAKGLRASGDIVEAVNAEVLGMLGKAVERCVDNKRGTVRPYDL